MNTRNIYVMTARQLLGADTPVHVEYGGKHPRVVATINGVSISHPFPGTPSGHRSLLNWRAQFKRRLATVHTSKEARI